MIIISRAILNEQEMVILTCLVKPLGQQHFSPVIRRKPGICGLPLV